MPPKKTTPIVKSKVHTSEEPSILSNVFKDEIIRIIDQRLKINQGTLAQKDIINIIDNIMPDFDKMISTKVKKHIKFLGENLIKLAEQE
jgi:hypothetical protein